MENHSDGVKAKPRRRLDPLITHALRDIIDWEFLANQGLARSFLNSINTDPFSGPQWMNLFQINEPVYQELVRELFSSFEFDSSPCRYDPQHLGITFRLGGEQREMSLLEFRWRISLYIEQQSRDRATLSGLSRAEMVKANLMLLEFWPNIGDKGFNVGNTKVKSIRDPDVRLAHRCIATTISGRKESTHRVTKMDLYYLYCIYTNEVVCNISYWLAKYLKSVGDKNLICGGMLITRISRYMMGDAAGLLFKEEDEGDDEGNEAAGEYVGREGVGGSADIYRNMSQGDWQVR
ncbi:retrotransposon ORF1 [Tanacetum coccineum]|uniref:Retrotransposon ORF1 n=1 Tax=Tanacetum coccineum TaxID=301880 RepID=A0ABQ5F542_9ASTR